MVQRLREESLAGGELGADLLKWHNLTGGRKLGQWGGEERISREASKVWFRPSDVLDGDRAECTCEGFEEHPKKCEVPPRALGNDAIFHQLAIE